MENKAENIENHSEDLCPQDLSRRNFLKFGMNSFLGMIALKHLQLLCLHRQIILLPLQSTVLFFL